MSKIINFTLSYEQFYNSAVKCDLQENHFGALEFVNRAIEIIEKQDKDSSLYMDCLLLKAESLCSIGAYAISNDVLFKAYKIKSSPDIFFALAYNFYMMDDMSIAAHYAEMCLSDSEDDELSERSETLLEYIHAGMDDKVDKIEQLLRIAEGISNTNQPDFALDVLKFVPEHSIRYVDALHYSATIYMRKGDNDMARQCITKADELCEGDDLSILSTAVVVAAKQGDHEAMDEYMQRIGQVESSVGSALMSCVVYAFSLAKNHALLVNFVEKYSRFCLYNDLVYLFSAIAYYNLNDKERALAKLKTVLLVNPNNEVARYWHKAFLDDVAAPVEYSSQLPEQEMMRKLTFANNVKEDDFDNGVSEELQSVIRWAIAADNYDLIAMLLNRFGHVECLCEYLRPYLLRDEVHDMCKKLVLFSLLEREDTELCMVLNGKLKRFSFKFPVLPNEQIHLYASYSYALSVLAFIDVGFEDECLDVFVKMFNNYMRKGAPRISAYLALAAVIAYNMNVFGGDTVKLCEVFACNRTTFNRYKKLFGDDDD